MKRCFCATLIVSFVVILLATQVNAALIVDVRAISADPAKATISTDGKLVTIIDPTAVINFGAYAYVTSGTNGTDPIAGSVQNAGGILRATRPLDTTWTVRGNMGSPELQSLWTNTSSNPGAVVDNNTVIDGDLDIGQQASGKYIYARGYQYNPVDASTVGILLESFNYSVSGVNPVGTVDTLINWVGYPSTGGWKEGTAIKSGNIKSGSAVQVTYKIPEPSTLILLGISCLALLAIRRRK